MKLSYFARWIFLGLLFILFLQVYSPFLPGTLTVTFVIVISLLLIELSKRKQLKKDSIHTVTAHSSG